MKFWMIAVLALATSTAATAQSLFSPAARIDDAIVTRYEVEQRVQFLRFINAPGGTYSAALEGLIEDALRRRAAAEVGLGVNDEELLFELEAFAQRANLTSTELIELLDQAGIAPETFRDFVAVNILWRNLIRARYGNRVNITEAEIDRALSAAGSGSSLRVLLSEIIVPAPANRAAEVQALAEEISASQSEAEFSSFARRFSATASRGNGGRLPWTPLTDLPEQLRPIILALSVGEVTDPLPIQGAVALFQLRGLEETGVITPEVAAVEYAAYYIPGGRSEAALQQAARIANQVDVCDDLYGVAKGQPPEVLERGTLPPSEIPQDIALELSKLDPGEVSTALTRADGQTLVFLMLCGRTAVAEEEVDREAVASALRNSRLAAFADSLLAELRAGATITVFE